MSSTDIPSAPAPPSSQIGIQILRPHPQLQGSTAMSLNTSLAVTPDFPADVDRRLNLESSEEDEEDEDSMTDASSDSDEERQVPQGLPVSTLPTGLCYDERMRYHSEVAAMTGENVHPEDPRRIYYIYKELCEAGLVALPGKGKPLVDPPLFRIDARQATKNECLLIHTNEHYEFVRSTAEMNDDELIELSDKSDMDSIYFNAFSYFSSKLSAGAAIETCRAVFSGKVKNAIAVIRPPGHHAEVQSTMGFCLFNNVCIASKVCQGEFGDSCRKILIVDWDVHHGNGCQKAFYNDPNILYISLHVHMNGQFYPSGNYGDMYHCGEGPGMGKNVNIPWPTKGMGNADYMYAFQHVVMPIATEFDPDFVVVASGFDAAEGDELGGCFVTPACYAHMTHMLMSLAGGKIAVCLEGGYNFAAISRSALAVTRTLMGEPPDRLEPTQPTSSALETVHKVKQVQSRFWRSIYPQDPVAGMFGGDQLHVIIREWQAMHLYDKFRLTNLHINRESVSPSFNMQVLATPDYDEKDHLLLILHDPPDLLGPYSSTTTLHKPHQTWMVDGAQKYIQWAVERDFGVIDVNIPEHITINDPRSGYHQEKLEYNSQTEDAARREGEKLIMYLWENYIEPNAFQRGITLIGAGNAFHAVAKLISDHETVHNSLNGIVAFIATNSVRPINSNNTYWIGNWYREHSRVYVAKSHNLWKREGKISRRYGTVYKSDSEVLNEMMNLHFDETTEWISQMHGLEVMEIDSNGQVTEDNVPYKLVSDAESTFVKAEDNLRHGAIPFFGAGAVQQVPNVEVISASDAFMSMRE